MNCTCGHSSFAHLHYGRYEACRKCTDGACPQFTFKGCVPFALDEAFTVLDVLDEDRYWRADRRILARGHFGRNDKHVPPLLVRDHEYEGNDFYELTDRVVAELLTDHLVQGEKHWGYTDMSTLRISDAGRIHLMNQLDRIGIPPGRWSHRPYVSDWLKLKQGGLHGH